MAASLLPKSRGVETVTNVGGGGGDCVLCRSPISEEGSHVVIRWATPSGGEQSAALHPLCHGIWLVIAKRVRQQPVPKRRG
jgi:hypothetical protein